MLKQAIKKLVIFVMSITFGLILWGCSDREEKETAIIMDEIPIEKEDLDKTIYETIKIGAIDKTSIELLNYAKDFLEDEGVKLELVEYQDAAAMNEDLTNKEIQAHLFAHLPYIESYNLKNDVDFISLDVLWYEVYGIYGGLKQDLTFTEMGARIAIPENETEQARALLLLDELGYLVVNKEHRETVSIEDILENPKQLSIHTVPEDEFKNVPQKYDYLVCGGYTAAQCGYDTIKDPLGKELKDMLGVQLLGTHLVSLPENKNNKDIELLKKAFQSDDMESYLKYMLKGTVAVK